MGTAKVFRGFKVNNAAQTAQKNAQTARYTAKQLAAEFEVADVTLRTRWLPYLLQVWSIADLKDGKGFTELARELFTDYATNVANGSLSSDEWVKSKQVQYSKPFESPKGEVLDAEFVNESSAGALTLASASSRVAAMQARISTNGSAVTQLIEENRLLRSQLDQVLDERAKQRGIQRGQRDFWIEQDAQTEEYMRLQQEAL